MSLLINKDGNQLGPYSLDEARALVLSGEIDATDWAWPDKATDWVRLKDVPGFSDALPARPAPLSAQAPDPAAPLPAEEELWRGHPSQLLNLPTYMFWLIALIVAAGGAMLIWPHSQPLAAGLIGLVLCIALAQSAWAYFHLRVVE